MAPRSPGLLATAALVSLVAAPSIVLLARGPQASSAPSTDTRRAGAPPLTGARDPAWSPDNASIAFSLLDQIWVMTREGQAPRALVVWGDGKPAIERDPAWSPDGRRVAFAANRGDGFDLFVVSAAGGAPERVSFLPGDERWPSWTPDGRLIFAHRTSVQWDLYRALPAAAPRPGAPPVVVSAPEQLTDTPGDDTEPRVSPDGTSLLFVSTRDSEAGDADLWMLPLQPSSAPPASTPAAQDEGEDAPASASQPPNRGAQPGSGSAAGSVSPSTSTAPTTSGASTTSIHGTPVRVLRIRGDESSPTWAPDSRRVAFSAVTQGLGTLWVAELELPGDANVARPVAPPQLVSRHGGQVAWSPDGRLLLVTNEPDRDPLYNGNPRRDDGEAPPLFALDGFRARLLPAPQPPDEGEVTVVSRLPATSARWLPPFEQVWRTLRDLYYPRGAGAEAWQALHDVYAPRAAAARDEAGLEAVVDDMVAEQPLIKPPVVSRQAVVVSGHRLASEAGVAMLARGGNVVDAAIAVSFALGVVEPDASGIGGDGQAIVFLKGMKEPTVIEFKDQTPIHATLDNTTIFKDGRLVGDGPAAANIPGVVAGLGYLYDKYGSKRVRWEELVAPAIRHADEGYVLDESLPTSVTQGQVLLAKYEAARKIFLPNGRPPKPGDRFVNRDYAATLRAIAAGGASEFYQGEIARRIAADMAENGGIIGYDDLAQYRAVERAPLSGRYRDHIVFSPPPPVSSGATLIETLQILDHYAARPGASVTRDADYLHYVIEASKVRHPLMQVADPALWPVNVTPHLDYAHAGELFAHINPSRASRFRGEAEERRDPTPRAGDTDRIGRGTTAFVVADAEGNMVAVTQTLSTWGGSFYVSKGLGFLYNNHLRSSRATRGAFGQLLPLTRSSSTSVPTLLFREVNGVRTPRLAVGAAGNAWIVPSVYTIITNVVDGGRAAQAAVEAPRLLVGRDPADPVGTAARVQIEDRIPRAVLQDLAKRGHTFQKIGRKGEVRYGYASAAVVDVDARTVEGGADPRRSHAAVAVETDGGVR
jgi:gamma-glutamyltranspeptidase